MKRLILISLFFSCSLAGFCQAAKKHNFKWELNITSGPSTFKPAAQINDSLKLSAMSISNKIPWNIMIDYQINDFLKSGISVNHTYNSLGSAFEFKSSSILPHITLDIKNLISCSVGPSLNLISYTDHYLLPVPDVDRYFKMGLFIQSGYNIPSGTRFSLRFDVIYIYSPGIDVSMLKSSLHGSYVINLKNINSSKFYFGLGLRIRI